MYSDINNISEKLVSKLDVNNSGDIAKAIFEKYELGNNKSDGYKQTIPVREFASSCLDIYKQLNLADDDDRLYIETDAIYHDNQHRDAYKQRVNIIDMLKFVKDCGIKNLAIHACLLLYFGAYSFHNSYRLDVRVKIPDDAILLTFMDWYASFDADFMTAFYIMPRGAISSGEIASYLMFSPFLEHVCEASDIVSNPQLALDDILPYLVYAPKLGLRNLVSDIIGLIDENQYDFMQPDYQAMDKLTAQHAGDFRIDGVSFESLESGIASVPYQQHERYLEMPAIDEELEYSVFKATIVQNAPVSIMDFAISNSEKILGIVTDEKIDQQSIGLFFKLLNKSNAIMQQKIDSDDKSVENEFISNDPEMQRIIVDAARIERHVYDSDNRNSNLVSAEIYSLCIKQEEHKDNDVLTDKLEQHYNADDEVWHKCLDMEASGFGTYHNSLVHLIPSIASAARFAYHPEAMGNTLVSCSVADVLKALYSIDCAVSYIDRIMYEESGREYPATRLNITNCYSEDVDTTPAEMNTADVAESLEAEMKDDSRIIACAGLPVIFLPAYLFACANGDLDDSGVLNLEEQIAFTKPVVNAYRQLAAGSCDPCRYEHNMMPNQLMRMSETRGNLMAQHNAFSTLSENGVPHDQLSPTVSMLAMMEFYACIKAEGSYEKYIKDVGHITAIIHDEMVSIDIINELKYNVIGSYEIAGQEHTGDTYSGASNPMNTTINDNSTNAKDARTHYDVNGKDNTLLEYGKDLSVQVEQDIKDNIRHGIGREQVAQTIGMILNSSVRNVPVIVGAPGSGRMDAVMSFLMQAKQKKVPGFESCDGFLMGESTLRANFNNFSRVMTSAKSSGKIIIINDIAMIRQSAAIWNAFLASDAFRIVIADSHVWKEWSVKYSDITESMMPVFLPSLSEDDIADILWQKADEFNKNREKNIVIKQSAINAIVHDHMDADSLAGTVSPAKEIEVLSYAMSYADAHEIETVSNAEVKRAMQVLSADSVNDDALDFDAEPFASVAGQSKAKEIVLSRLKASSAGLYDTKGPRNLFMFCGPSGCGKTLLAAQINSVLGLSDDNVLTIPMSEYSTQWEGSRLIGSAPGYVGYEKGGMLTNFVRKHPHGVLILDEIEKAHQTILMMFLNMFDTGMIESARGEQVDCHGLTIVCTSNAAFDDYTGTQHIGFITEAAPTYDQQVASVRSELVRRLGAPFVGRIPDIVIFNELSKKDMIEAIKINYRQLVQSYKKRLNRDVTDIVSMDDAVKIAEQKMDEVSHDVGVRGLWKQVEHEINNIIMDKLLSE